MTRLVKISEVLGPSHRVYEQKISTEEDFRELVAHLRHQMRKAATEGKQIVVELWTEFEERELPALQFVRENQVVNCS